MQSAHSDREASVPDVRRLTLPAGLDPLFWRVLAGVLVSAAGTGLTLPFLPVYLHDVRGIDTTAAALIIAWLGLTALAGTPAPGARALSRRSADDSRRSATVRRRRRRDRGVTMVGIVAYRRASPPLGRCP